MNEVNQIKIATNKIAELIYKMYLKDLKAGNIKGAGSKLQKKKSKVKNDKNTLFSYTY